MKKFKKVLRRVVFVFIIMMAAAGAGMFGAIMPTYRRQDDLTTKIEMVEVSKKDGEEEQSVEEKQ